MYTHKIWVTTVYKRDSDFYQQDVYQSIKIRDGNINEATWRGLSYTTTSSPASSRAVASTRDWPENGLPWLSYVTITNAEKEFRFGILNLYSRIYHAMMGFKMVVDGHAADVRCSY